MLRAGRRCGSNEMGIPLQRLPHQKQPLPVCSPLEKATASQAFPLEQLLQGKCCSITCQLYRWMAVLVIQGQLSVWLTEGSSFMMSICPDRAYRQWLSSWVNPFNIWLAIDYGLPYACVLPKSSSLLFLTYILECSRWYTLVFDVFLNHYNHYESFLVNEIRVCLWDILVMLHCVWTGTSIQYFH